MDPITKTFIAQMEQFAKQQRVPMVAFEFQAMLLNRVRN
jgi:hypothetical protein